MNRKGVALPTSSEETKKSKRECLDQKQILVPELCAIHPFRASLWRQAVALPCVFYRLNGLLVADALRARIAREARIGLPALPPAAPRWDTLSFGWTLADVVSKNGPGDVAEGKESSKPKRNRIKEGTSLAKDDDDADSGKEAPAATEDNLDLLSDRLVNEINEEDKKLKKQSMDIGMWSNDMIAPDGGRGSGSNRSRSGSRSGGGVGGSEDFSDFSDTDSEVDVHAALPDNLTLISNNDNK